MAGAVWSVDFPRLLPLEEAKKALDQYVDAEGKMVDAVIKLIDSMKEPTNG